MDIFVQLGNLSVATRIEGNGAPLVLLHGWGGKRDSWLPVIRHYAENYTVYVLDFPGFGQTPEPPHTWDVTDYAALVDEWLEALGVRGAYVIGHSFGGRVAILLAARYPHRVAKLVLTDAAGLIPKRSFRYYVKVYTYKIGKVLSRLLGLPIEKLMKKAGSPDYQQLSQGMRKIFTRVVNQDLSGYLPDIQAPTLLIYGREDKETPVAFGEYMEKHIPDAGLVVLENAGHFAYLDQFPSFCKIVNVFLKEDEA
ncbi:MAG: alpha/beta fold hydrolase [Christensenellales bacterium]|jgi:pimeloyl-ACP methyl ester carboxylesterase